MLKYECVDSGNSIHDLFFCSAPDENGWGSPREINQRPNNNRNRAEKRGNAGAVVVRRPCVKLKTRRH